LDVGDTMLKAGRLLCAWQRSARTGLCYSATGPEAIDGVVAQASCEAGGAPRSLGPIFLPILKGRSFAGATAGFPHGI